MILIIIYILIFWLVASVAIANRKTIKDLDLRTERLEQRVNYLLIKNGLRVNEDE